MKAINAIYPLAQALDRAIDDELGIVFHTHPRAASLPTGPPSFTFATHGKKRRVSGVPVREILITLKEEVALLDLRAISFEESWKLRIIVDVFERLIHTYPFSEGNKTSLMIEIHRIRLGGRLPRLIFEDPKYKDFVRFLVASGLPNKFLCLRLPIQYNPIDGPLLPIQNGQDGTLLVPWGHLEKKRMKGGNWGYFYRDSLVFTTDQGGCLDDSYSLFDCGIVKHNIYKVRYVRPYDHQTPPNGGQSLFEIWISSRRKKGDMTTVFSEIHAYMILRDRLGNIYSIGQDIFTHELKKKIHTLFGAKEGYNMVMSPDRYVFKTTAGRDFQRFVFPVDDDALKRILAEAERDKRSMGHIMSVLNGNCVSYAKKMIKIGLGIDIHTRMLPLHTLIKAGAPGVVYHKLIRPYLRLYLKLAPKVRKALCFFPPYYVLHVLIGAIVKGCLSFSPSKKKEMVTWKNLFFHPWQFGSDHPFILAESLDVLSKGDRCVIKDDSM